MKIDELKKSAEIVTQLLPVLKDGHGITIDGFHRKAADINWKEVTLEWVTTEGQRLMVQIASNWIRRPIKKEEKTKILVRLCEIFREEWKGHYSRELAKITGFNIDTIEKYLPPEYKQKKEPKPWVISPSMSLEEIKQVAKKHNSYSEFQPKDSEKVPMPSEHSPFFLKYHDNVWVADIERPKGCGDASFPGNTSPNLAQDMLNRYTNKGDLVVDMMAGSGTINDMCKELDRDCDGYDNAPLRSDISKGDARNLPYKDNSVDFVFSHFPYHDMVDYGGDENNLSRMSAEQFLRESKKVMVEAHRILKPDKYYAVLIGDQRKDGEVIDWSAEFSRMGKELFKLHDKIIWHAKGQSAYRGSDLYDLIAAENNFCKQVFDTLLVFKK